MAIKDGLQYYTPERPLSSGDFERLFLPPPNSQEWRDLGKLFSRPWFQRLWIIQEVALSFNLSFLCGQELLSWNDMAMFAICLLDNDMESLLSLEKSAEGVVSESGCTRVRQMSIMRDYERTFPQQSMLLQALVEGRGAQATDARDKVYGVMGMTSIAMYPNYGSPVTDVYTDAARKILESEGVLRPEMTHILISLLCCVDHEQPLTDLPSWVPDWSLPRQTVSLGFHGSTQGIYQIARNMLLHWKYHQDGISLIISAYCFDIVRSVGPLAGSDLKDSVVDESSTSKFFKDSLSQIADGCREYPGNSGFFEALWKTLVAGKDHTGMQKAPDDYEAIFALLIDTITGRSPSFADQPSPKRKLTLANLEVHHPRIIYRQMQTAFTAAVQGRRFGTTINGYMGLFPRGTRVGDLVIIFLGGHVPFILRQREMGNSYQLVGECYQHGIMDGQIMQTPGLEWQDIQLS
ncbi:MAG: hypothetical protein Q9225_000292 [Loekoesia sp. 1 TL-2023]